MNCTIPTQTQIDTLDGSSYNIIFFRPSETEYEKLLKQHDLESGLNEIDSDHGYYANKVIDSFEQTKVKVVMTNERIIQLAGEDGPIFFDRSQSKTGVYGLIFCEKGCSPKIEYGVMTDIDIYREYNMYTNNCR